MVLNEAVLLVLSADSNSGVLLLHSVMNVKVNINLIRVDFYQIIDMLSGVGANRNMRAYGA